MPKGRAATNMAMGRASLPSGITNRPTLPVQASPQALAAINKIPMPMTPPVTMPSVPLNTVPAGINRVPSIPSAPNTLAPPIIGGPPLTMPSQASMPVNMPMPNPMLRRQV